MESVLPEVKRLVYLRLEALEASHREDAMCLRRYYRLRHDDDMARLTARSLLALARSIESLTGESPVHLYYAVDRMDWVGRTPDAIPAKWDRASERVYTHTPESAAAGFSGAMASRECFVVEVLPESRTGLGDGYCRVGTGDFFGIYHADAAPVEA